MRTFTKTYSELILLPTFEERFEYLRLDSSVGRETFGRDRWINQEFYHSREWLEFRRRVIRRDDGCDLGCVDRPIQSRVIIHHLNPITIEDVMERRPCVFDLNNVICTQHGTHNAIHYGDISLLPHELPERRPNDTCPWRQ